MNNVDDWYQWKKISNKKRKENEWLNNTTELK